MSKKIEFNIMVHDLVKEIDQIDSSDLTQKQKTIKYKSAAKKFKSAIFHDKRKYGGEKEIRRITLATYSAYLSRARKKFDSKIHHSFEKEIKKVQERFTMFPEDLAWFTTIFNDDKKPNAIEVRTYIAKLRLKLESGSSLKEPFSDIDFTDGSAAKHLKKLIKKYPLWESELNNCITKDLKIPKSVYEKLCECSSLKIALETLKINHEVIYQLALTKEERELFRQKSETALSEKKRNVVIIDYPSYMNEIYKILNSEYDPSDLVARRSVAPLAFALAAASGRRMIEISFTGVFEKINDHEMWFSGQAKKRMDEGERYKIYCLFKVDLFLEKLNILRESSALSDFLNIANDLGGIETRSGLQKIKDVSASAWNPFVKNFFRDEKRHFSNSRAIYARIAFEKYFKIDPRWQKVDEDVFFSEMLGHDDEETQKHYKTFKLKNFDPRFKPEMPSNNPRLAALIKFDDEMPDFAKGDAGIRIHDWVKQQITEDPDKKITTTNLRNEYGANPTMAKRYLDLVASALGMEKSEAGHYVQFDDRPKIISDYEYDESLEDEKDEESEEADDVEEINEKPKFTAVPKTDGKWAVEIDYKGKKYEWRGDAGGMAEAMRNAWESLGL